MKQLANYITQKTFDWVHQKNLVYNTCWEDPRCDRALMDFNKDSNVVMITSAGCNALDYLLDLPNKIHCIDVNPRQNALLKLKTAAFSSQSSHSDLFQMFGDGCHSAVKDYYYDVLNHELSGYAQHYWQKNISFFSGKGVRRSFYNHGTSGLFAWGFAKYLKYSLRSSSDVEALLNASNLDEQKEIYERIEHKIFNQFIEWLMNKHLIMCMLGVPKAQQNLLNRDFEKGAIGFIKSSLQRIFTEIPIAENYFWRVYMTGSYTNKCCPNYLKPENYATISANKDKINTYDTTVSSFLQSNPGNYSHYILLDHQDWLAHHLPEALEEEWKLILDNSSKGTKILLRSASSTVDFFPDFVKEKVVFEKEKTEKWHQLDRVGTYASVYLGEVQ